MNTLEETGRRLTKREYVIQLSFQLAEEIVPYEDGGLFDWQYLFYLARRIKSDQALNIVSLDSQSVRICKEAVAAFSRRIIELEKYSQWVEFEDLEECWERFVDAWHKVIHLEGDTPLETAFDLAVNEPIVLREDSASHRLGLLASTAYHLQLLNGDRPIILPCELVGKLFHKDKRAGSRLIGMLMRTGLIEMCKDYNHGRREAREYRFLIHRTDLYEPS